MKKLILIALLMAFSFLGKAQVKNLISTKLISSAGVRNEKHIITLAYGQTENETDTLKIDNQIYFVLHNGDYGEQLSGSKKMDWANLFLGVIDKSTGRWEGKGTLDYDLKCYIYVGNSPQNKIVYKIDFYNHGSIVSYFN